MDLKIAEFKNLNVSYGAQDVLHDINLEIGSLEHSVILGANGSGKSTLIKLFSNDIYPRVLADSSKKLFGQTIWSVAELKNHLGIITNDLHYYLQNMVPNIAGFDVVVSSFFASIGIHEHHNYEEWHLKTAYDTMSDLGITHLFDTPICEMSTGELRRCVIARALVHNPSALLLDEPTVGLDIKAQFDFIEMMRSLATKKTVILITHHVEEIFPEIQKVILLKDGKILLQGEKDDVLTSQNLSDTFGVNLELAYENNRYFVKKV